MTISYKWLMDYMPVADGDLPVVDPQRLSRILTSIGLEVESLELYEEVKGGLEGLVVGEVLTSEKHPNADKLKLTTVDIGEKQPLQIVCGAPNVSVGQKVIVATVGTTIYPTSGNSMTMKLAMIRNQESLGMICAEDEIGLGNSHAGILVLAPETIVGSKVSDYFQPYQDWIYEIGLTPNRMDAMSHWGVARDVCAYLSYHDKKEYKPRLPKTNGFKPDNNSLPVSVTVENNPACPRYSGISIANLTIAESPRWLQQKLKAIGLRPINNIVDITNFIQHETGQPLHAFDADKISGRKVIVKNLPDGTVFITLDEKERKLGPDDLMICDEKEGMCIAGIYGGLHSGVTVSTKNIFLEGACFESIGIRKTSSRLGLKTDAASRYEKGTDISATVEVLKRAATMIRDICKGEIASEIVDVYPQPKEKTEVGITYHYMKKLSGKNYHPDAVKKILGSLGFEFTKDGIDELRVLVPYHKPDIHLPADIVEEVLRIDGFDSITIPDAITITPSVGEHYAVEAYLEKTAGYLVGLGFYEIMTNSITNSNHFDTTESASMVRLLNNLSADLNCMRPSMLETGLESIAYNLNRRNTNLRFFEFGKTYSVSSPKKYEEEVHLCLYITGQQRDDHWRNKAAPADFFDLKGVASSLLEMFGIPADQFEPIQNEKLKEGLQFRLNGRIVLQFGAVNRKLLTRFDIKQPVFFADFIWTPIVESATANKQVFKDPPRFPAVQRDLAIVVTKQLPYEKVEQTVQKIRLNKLQSLKLFDIFESEKLGAGKKSMAINFTFNDEEKTLTDKEIEGWMSEIISALEKDLQAEIRK